MKKIFNFILGIREDRDCPKTLLPEGLPELSLGVRTSLRNLSQIEDELFRVEECLSLLLGEDHPLSVKAACLYNISHDLRDQLISLQVFLYQEFSESS